jgi:hypothetical protein
MNGKIDRALASQDFDAALKAIADYPASLRASSYWIQQGPPREAELVRRRVAYCTGKALLAEAHRMKDNKAAVEGLFAAFPDEYRQMDEGKAIAQDFVNLIAQGTQNQIDITIQEAKKRREEAETANYTRSCEKRAKIVAESEGDFHKELGDDLFEWQVYPGLMTGTAPKDAINLVNGKLVLKNEGEGRVYIGKNKRDWTHLVVELKIKVSKGAKAFFCGQVRTRSGSDHDYDWDMVPITGNAVTEKDRGRPHGFQGVPEETTVTLQYRFIGKSWDVVVNGKDVFLIGTPSTSPVGGFGLECTKGTIEVEEVKSKVLGRRTANGDEE